MSWRNGARGSVRRETLIESFQWLKSLQKDSVLCFAVAARTKVRAGGQNKGLRRWPEGQLYPSRPLWHST